MVPIVPETGNFRNDFPENFRNNIPERYGNFRFTKKNRSGIPVFRNLFHNGNGKNFRIISARIRNPEFRWIPY